MNIKRWLFLSIALYLGLLVASFACMAGQQTNAGVSARTLISDSSTSGQTINPDSSADHIEFSGNAVAVDPVFEFDPVLEGETVVHEFTIKNTGMDELKILKVRTG